MSDLALEADGLEKSYETPAGRVEVLRGVDLRLTPGEIAAVTGPSGCGKTTLLHLLGLLDRSDAGTLRIGGEDAARLSARSAAAVRNRRIGFVFQFHGLLPEFSALENAAMPLLIRGAAPAAARAAAARLLEALGLAARLEHRPAALSGGEAQRVAIARALVGGPSVVLADEPTGDLDEETGVRVADLLLGTVRASGAAVLLVTHNPDLAARADRRYRLEKGRLREV